MAQRMVDPEKPRTEDDAAAIWKAIRDSGEELTPEPGDIPEGARRRAEQELRQRRRAPSAREEVRDRRRRLEEEGEDTRERPHWERQRRDERGKWGELDDEPLDDEEYEEDEPDDDPEEWDDEGELDDRYVEEIDPSTPIRLKADGEEIEVPFEELKKGYARTAYMTRVTQEAAATRREAEAVAQQMLAERQQYAALNARLAQQLEQSIQPPDPELEKTNPTQYLLQEKRYRERQAEIEAAKNEHRRAQMANMRAQEALREAALEREEQALMAAVPEWQSDPDRGVQERRELFNWAQERWGWSPQELANVTDHRLMLILRDSKRLHDLESGVEQRKLRRKGKRGIRPGVTTETGRRRTARRQERGVAQERRKAVERVRETGSRRDAEAAVAAYLRSQR